MCGFAGFLESAALRSEEELESSVRAMATTLRHRGPDDHGTWVDAAAGVGLGSRRLAIVDLSPAGHQPMHSASGRFAIAYNGEVYNFNRLREELESEHVAPQFRGHSDTEVILASIEAWGLEAAVRRFIGMFAFALWDRRDRVLHLVRDRLGVKPLYYGWFGEALLFGSELKALRAHPAFSGDIDRNALTLLLRHDYIPAPYTIHKTVCKLLPGTILSVPASRHSDPFPVPYWSAAAMAEKGKADPFRGSAEEAADQLDSLLRSAVGLRMIADVPLGVFLSGGVDSSTVVALMQAQSDRPVRSFSIGFHEDSYNEARNAKAIATHLGTDHTELYVTAEEALAVIPKLPMLYDEPFADSSQIPTYLVSALARRCVTVSLSGDGGDEVFGGYNRYTWGPLIWRNVGWVPRWLRRCGAWALTTLSSRSWDSVFRRMGAVLPAQFKQPNPGESIAKLADVLAVDSPKSIYRTLVSHWKDPAALVPDSFEPVTIVSNGTDWADAEDFAQEMMTLDLMTYLPDDILAKVDRASMGVSLEAREPLLDHRLVEFALTLPSTQKIRDGQSKWLLRQVLYRYVPRELIERPKMGFAVPLGGWLRGPLRDWAEELLSEKRLLGEGFLDPRPIRGKWMEHLSGQRNWQNHLWSVLMFQAWLNHWGS